MKTFLSILAVALFGIAVQAQDKVKQKPAETQAAKGDEVQGKAPKAKEAEQRMKDFDINFRGQEQRVRNSIYTLGGRLTPPGKKPGEGC